MKFWTVEFSYPTYGGGRAYGNQVVKAEFEADARIHIMRTVPGSIPMAVFESKAAPGNRAVEKAKK